MTTGVCNFAQPDQTVYFNYTTSGYEGAGVYALYRTRLSPGCTGFTPPAGMTLHSFCPAVPGSGCGSSQMYRKKQSSVPPRTETPIIESDWTEAETKLNAQPQQTVEALYNSDAPVPVSAATAAAPVTQTLASSTTQIKDQLGNITGTQTQTTTVTITDQSTTNNITYNIEEKTIIEDYNASNELIGSQETTSSNQPPEPPKPPEQEDITMDHGGVPEIPLLTQTIDVQEELDNNQQAPWSTGTCPPDIDLGIYGLEFSLTPFCNFATNVRPIVLMLGAFLSFYILSGAKFN